MRFVVVAVLILATACSPHAARKVAADARPQPLVFTRAQIAQHRIDAQLTARLRRHLGMPVQAGVGDYRMPPDAIAAARLAKAHPELALGQSTVLGAMPKDQDK